MKLAASTVAALLLASPTSSLQALPSAGCIDVVDGNGKTVGLFLDEVDHDIDGRSRIALDLHGRVVTVLADSTGFVGGDDGANWVVFESLDCSGDPFVPINEIPSKALLPRTAITGANLTLYEQVFGEVARNVSARSALFFLDGTCYPFPLSVFAVRAVARQDLGTVFQPPFRVTDRRCRTE